MSRFLRNVLLFGRALRKAGVAVSLEQTLSFARALEHVDIARRDQVFHAARSFLVNRREDLALFGSVFDQFWLGIVNKDPLEALRITPQRQPGERRRYAAGFLGARRPGESVEVEIADRAGTYSPDETLRQKDFSLLTAEETEEVQRLIRETRWGLSLRRTRRMVPGRRGPKIHLRRMLRDAAKFDGVPPSIHRLRAKLKQRPVVLLADISGSMEKYSRLIVQFFFAASHSLRDVECFVFGTRLTRITHQLKLRNADRALEQAARKILDWSGGTRIGESLATFNRHWGRRVLRRGTVVVIVSDGWERGDVGDLSRQMQRLHRRCYRLIWLNPYVARPGYEPRVAGMSAALAYVDDFLPMHNLNSLRALSERLEDLPTRRNRRSGGMVNSPLTAQQVSLENHPRSQP